METITESARTAGEAEALAQEMHPGAFALAQETTEGSPDGWDVIVWTADSINDDGAKAIARYFVPRTA